MKQCFYCGKTYADEATVCERDQKPLVEAGPPVMGNTSGEDGEKYHTFWRRVGAAIVDGVVLCPMTIGLMFALSRGVSFGTYVWVSLGSFALTIVYNVAMTAQYGQTLGKMATGVKIVRVDEAPIGLKEAAIRYGVFVALGLVITIISLMGLRDESVITNEVVGENWKAMSAVNWGWAIAQLITVASNERRRAIHDYVSGTQVVVWKKA